MYGRQHFQPINSTDQPGIVANPARGQLKQGKYFFLPCTRSRLRFWSREIGSAAHSLHPRLNLPTNGIPTASRNCVPMAFTAGRVRGTRPVVLNVVPVTGATFSGFTIDQFLCASLFPHQLLENVYEAVRLQWTVTMKSTTIPFPVTCLPPPPKHMEN